MRKKDWTLLSKIKGFLLLAYSYCTVLARLPHFAEGNLTQEASQCTPFENAQRWMGKNTFPILLLNDDNMIGEH